MVSRGNRFDGDEKVHLRIRNGDGSASDWILLSLPMVGVMVKLWFSNEEQGRCRYNGGGRGGEYVFDFLRATIAAHVVQASKDFRISVPPIEEIAD